jgi:uncharacterized RDD family membrane protein YckC
MIASGTTPEATFGNPDPGPTGLGGPAVFLVGALAFAGFFLYRPVLEGRPEGQTFGKQAMGTRVVRQSNGAPLGYGLAIGRNVARLADGALFGLGAFWAIWDPQHQTWHDKIAGTLVVRSAHYPAPPKPGSAPPGYPAAPPSNPYQPG